MQDPTTKNNRVSSVLFKRYAEDRGLKLKRRSDLGAADTRVVLGSDLFLHLSVDGSVYVVDDRYNRETPLDGLDDKSVSQGVLIMIKLRMLDEINPAIDKCSAIVVDLKNLLNAVNRKRENADGIDADV